MEASGHHSQTPMAQVLNRTNEYKKNTFNIGVNYDITKKTQVYNEYQLHQ